MKSKLLEEAIGAVVQIYVEGFLTDEFFNILDPHEIKIGFWSASGSFIRVSDKEGYILTNAHVVKNGLKFKIRTLLTSEESFEATLLCQIESFEPDIALLKLEDYELLRIKEMIGKIPFLELEDDQQIQRDLSIKVIGYPLGMKEPNITSGKVSNFIYGDEYGCEKIVTDAAINYGNSGGPAVTEEGKIIGINTSIALNANDIGFITPVSFVRIVIQNLTRGKETVLTCLGASFQKNSHNNARYLKAPSYDGIIITSILPGSMIALAGVQPRDILYKINDYEFDSHGIVKTQKSSRHKNIYDIVRLIPLNSKIILEVWRNGGKLIKEARAIPFPELRLKGTTDLLSREFIAFKGIVIQETSILIIQSLIDFSPVKLKYYLDLLLKDDKRLIVTFVTLNSYGEELDIAPGDIISNINGKSINNLTDLKEILNQLSAQNLEIVFAFESGSLGVFPKLKKIEILNPKAIAELNFFND